MTDNTGMGKLAGGLGIFLLGFWCLLWGLPIADVCGKWSKKENELPSYITGQV